MTGALGIHRKVEKSVRATRDPGLRRGDEGKGARPRDRFIGIPGTQYFGIPGTQYLIHSAAAPQVTQKTVPASVTGAAAYSVFTGYNNRGLELYARFASAAGAGITNIYDNVGDSGDTEFRGHNT
jgi:hypothetical protein